MSDLSQFKENINTTTPANAVAANYFIGSGNNLSNIQGANVSGQVGNALVASVVYTNAQPNITSVGTLVNLTVSSNITSSNISVANITSSNTIVGNKIQATYFVGDGANLTGLAATYSNTNVHDYLPTFTGNIQSGNANLGNAVTANYFIGSGANLTTLTGANVTGQVSYAATANSVAVANVVGIGNIATINKDGNASNILYGNGVFASAPVTYGNSNVATYLGSYGSNIIITTGNVSVGNIIGNGQALTGLSGANVSGQVAFANVANNVAYANVSGKPTLATVATSGSYNDLTNKPTIPDGTYANLTGKPSLATVATSGSYNDLTNKPTIPDGTYANLTGLPTLGNLSSLNKDGNSSNILYGNGTFASAPVTYENSNVATFLGSYGSNTIVTTGNVTVGNIIGNGQALTGLAGANVTGIVANANSAAYLGTVAAASYLQVTGTGSSLTAITGANVTGAVSYATTANAVAGANVSGQVGNALVAGTVYTNVQPNITSVGTLSSLTVTANITSGNANLGNAVTSNYFIGSGNNLSNIYGANVSGTVALANSAAYLGAVSASGYLQVTGTGSSLTAITGANVTGQVSYAGTANSVAVANVVGIGNIATINKDGNASNILYGNGVFASAPVTYGNSNVATFLGSFGSNTISTTGSANVGSANVSGNLTANNANISNYLYIGSTVTTLYNNAPLSVTGANAGNTITGINIVNTGGGSGSGSGIDFYTYTGAGFPPEASIYSVDNGDYSANINFATKVPGAGANILATRMTITSNGSVNVPGTISTGNLIINSQTVSAIGAASPQYINVTNGSAQTVYATGTDIIWDTNIASSGITYNTSTGVFTLTAGVTYNIVGMLSFQGYSANGYVLYQVVDATTNSAIGSGQTASASYQTGFNEVNNTSIDIIYTPNTNQNIKFRVTGGSSGISAQHRGGGFSRASIIQLNPTVNLGAISTITTSGNVSVGGNISMTGGIRKSTRVLTTTTTLTIADASGFIEFAGSGTYTVTLPDPTLAANSGIGYRFWQNTSQNITLSTPAGSFFGPSGSSASTKVLVYNTTQYWDVWSDGYNWIVFGIKTV